MKRYKNWVRAAMLLLLTMLTTTGAWADQSKIIVWLKDGSKTEVPFDKIPEFVYDNGILNKHVPTVNRYELSADKDWVKVGGTTKVTLDSYSEKEATWDWSDVELVGQSSSYSGADNEDLGFFTWDASTQTLTSVKSNDNKDVYLKFALKNKPGVKDYISVKTGEGE